MVSSDFRQLIEQKADDHAIIASRRIHYFTHCNIKDKFDAMNIMHVYEAVRQTLRKELNEDSISL